MLIRIALIVAIFYFSLRICRGNFNQDYVSVVKEISEPDIHFDEFVFAQKWPVTYCKEWIHETAGKCVYPKQKNQWTVHGIWARKTNGQYVDYCNNSTLFDPEQIKPIEDDLNQAWTNIYKEYDTYKFWAHEWLKHGTCAALLEPFNSQLKYFSKGIEWNRKYSILDMLEAANIFPDDTKEFTPDVFINAVKAKSKRNPMMMCKLVDDEQFLEELRVCVDKQFNLVDCYPVVDATCDVTRSIIFPATA